MKTLMSIIKMTCKDVYPLISEEMDHSLSLPQRVQLKMHLAICKLCKIYSNQLQTLRSLARSLSKEDTKSSEPVTLNSEAKEKIQKHIEKEI